MLCGCSGGWREELIVHLYALPRFEKAENCPHINAIQTASSSSMLAVTYMHNAALCSL
jgi:hypothetical protein